MNRASKGGPENGSRHDTVKSERRTRVLFRRLRFRLLMPMSCKADTDSIKRKEMTPLSAIHTGC